MLQIQLSPHRPQRGIHTYSLRMQVLHMLIDSSRSLRATIAFGVIEIHGVDGEFAGRALELIAVI